MKTRYRFACFCLSLLATWPLIAQGNAHGSLLVLSKRDHTLAIVNPSNLQVVARVPVGNDPHEVIASTDGLLAANVRGANRLKFTLDGKLVFVSSLAGGDAVVLDAATRKEVKRVPIGHGAAGILMQPDGSRVFIACTPDSYVAVIDLKTLEVVGHIDAGGNPDGLAWATRR